MCVLSIKVKNNSHGNQLRLSWWAYELFSQPLYIPFHNHHDYICQ